MPAFEVDDARHLDAAVAALAGHNDPVAQVIERLKGNLPTYLSQVTAQIPFTSPTTLTLQPLANHLVRMTGFLASYPNTALTEARITIGGLVIDLPLTPYGAAVVVDGDKVTHFIHPTDPLTFKVAGTISGTTNLYATFWVWGEQQAELGMVS